MKDTKRREKSKKKKPSGDFVQNPSSDSFIVGETTKKKKIFLLPSACVRRGTVRRLHFQLLLFSFPFPTKDSFYLYKKRGDTAGG